MSESLPAPPEHGPDQDAARRRARVPIDALEGLLQHPAFAHNIGLNVLLKFAADDKLHVRERTRAGAALAALHLRVIDRLAAHLGSREVALTDAGVSRTPAAANTEGQIVINILPPPEQVAALNASVIDVGPAEPHPLPRADDDGHLGSLEDPLGPSVPQA